MSREDQRRPRRFRITIEGVTRYVSDSGHHADVTLTMPGPFRGRDGVTSEVRLGSMPLADVEWLPEPVKVGDVIDGADAFRALPAGAVVAELPGCIGIKTMSGRWEYSDNSRSMGPANRGTLVYLPAVTT